MDADKNFANWLAVLEKNRHKYIKLLQKAQYARENELIADEEINNIYNNIYFNATNSSNNDIELFEDNEAINSAYEHASILKEVTNKLTLQARKARLDMNAWKNTKPLK